jgi:hypothetical protein
LDADLTFSIFGNYLFIYFWRRRKESGGYGLWQWRKKVAARVFYGGGGRRWWLGFMAVADGDLQAAK